MSSVFFCPHCGASIDAGQNFCRKCGKPVGGKSYGNVGKRPKEPKEKLVQELAYSGVFFYLPLVFGMKDAKSRTCANQGLWILILSVCACTLMNSVSIILEVSAGYFFSGILNGIHGIVMMAGILFMLYLAGAALRNALAIHRDEELSPILFFDDYPILSGVQDLNG